MGHTLSTNLGLQTRIPAAISPTDLIGLMFDQSVCNPIIEAALAGVQSAATVGVNASVVATGGCRVVQLQLLSAGCIATITGQYTGVPFTLLFQSVGSIGLADAGVFKLNGAFNATLDDTLTLVWDGNNFYEIGRSAN